MNMTNSKELKGPIIFIGTGRSGTTIISEIIFRHKDLAFPINYQQKLLKSSRVNYIRRIFDNKLWRIFGQKKQLNKTSILNRIAPKPSEGYPIWKHLLGDEIDFSRGFLLDKKASEEKIKFVRDYYGKMVKFQNRKKLAFKITGPSRLEFLLSIFPDAKIVNITRQEIPTISSFLKVDFWKNRGDNQLWWLGAYSKKEMEWVEMNKKNPIAITTLQIKKIKEITKKEIEKLKPDYFELAYEDFVEQPGIEINKILNFLQLEDDNSCSLALKELNIINRNYPNSKYFSEKELILIDTILKT